jgi:hypothetical protein
MGKERRMFLSLFVVVFAREHNTGLRNQGLVTAASELRKRRVVPVAIRSRVRGRPNCGF